MKLFQGVSNTANGNRRAGSSDCKDGSIVLSLEHSPDSLLRIGGLLGLRWHDDSELLISETSLSAGWEDESSLDLHVEVLVVGANLSVDELEGREIVRPRESNRSI